MISMFGVFTNKPLYSKNIGETYQPKSSGLRVGRDVGALSYSSPRSQETRKVVVADGDDVKFGSTAIFKLAKSAAQQGFQIKNFRRVSNEDAVNGNLSALLSDTAAPSMVENGKYRVSYNGAASSGANLSIYEKVQNEDGKDEWQLLESRTVSTDTRVAWDEKGKPSILSGSAAYSKDSRGRDILKAEGGNEMIIRMSNLDVEAGSGTVIFNQGGSGNFHGGSGVTFLGSYGADSVISGTEGDNIYAGYFERVVFEAAANSRGTFSGVFEGVTIEGGNAGNIFSGYFSKSAAADDTDQDRISVINGGNGENRFDGLFMAGSQVNGGDQADRFNGRFMDSLVNGGAGNDIFGSYINLNQLKVIYSDEGKDENGDQRPSKVYRGLESDFIDSEVDAGEGDDSFRAVSSGSSIRMGQGDDKLDGVFTDSHIYGDEGDDAIAAMYSKGSIFETGAGEDRVDLATALSSAVIGGEGKNEIILGRNMDKSSGKRGFGETNGAAEQANGTVWMTKQESMLKHARGKEHGELHGNSVNASVGDNLVRVNDGEGTARVLTGDVYAEENVADRNESGKSPETRPATADASDQARGGISPGSG